MKAIVYSRYGSADVLRCEEVETPVPGDHEVLVRVRAASLNPYDLHLMTGTPYFLRLVAGLRRPKDRRLGVDLAGEVVSVGSGVTRFKPGEAVFGSGRGAFGDFVCAAEAALAAKPPNVSFDAAAAVPMAGLTALQGLRDKGAVQPGQKVLINGAAGGVGAIAVQIAKWLGAEVTGVCSESNMAFVRSLGADFVVDYQRDDFTRAAARYDLVFDLVGNRAFPACRRVLAPGGAVVVVGGPGQGGRGFGPWAARLLAGLITARFVSQRLVVFAAKLDRSDLSLLADLLQAGAIRPVVDRREGWSAVADGMRQLASGHVRGKIVIVPAAG